MALLSSRLSLFASGIGADGCVGAPGLYTSPSSTTSSYTACASPTAQARAALPQHVAVLAHVELSEGNLVPSSRAAPCSFGLDMSSHADGSDPLHFLSLSRSQVG